MKWYWLLALPYVVTVSSECVKYSDVTYTTNPPYTPCLAERTQFHVGNQNSWDKTEADDLAQALNDAHERRAQQPEHQTLEWNGKPAEYLTKDEFDKLAPPPQERGEKPE